VAEKCFAACGERRRQSSGWFRARRSDVQPVVRGAPGVVSSHRRDHASSPFGEPSRVSRGSPKLNRSGHPDPDSRASRHTFSGCSHRTSRRVPRRPPRRPRGSPRGPLAGGPAGSLSEVGAGRTPGRLGARGGDRPGARGRLLATRPGCLARACPRPWRRLRRGVSERTRRFREGPRRGPHRGPVADPALSHAGALSRPLSGHTLTPSTAPKRDPRTPPGRVARRRPPHPPRWPATPPFAAPETRPQRTPTTRPKDVADGSLRGLTSVVVRARGEVGSNDATAPSSAPRRGLRGTPAGGRTNSFAALCDSRLSRPAQRSTEATSAYRTSGGAPDRGSSLRALEQACAGPRPPLHRAWGAATELAVPRFQAKFASLSRCRGDRWARAEPWLAASNGTK
jgi:hypothetical protein